MRAALPDRCPTCGETRPLLSIKAAAKIASVNRKTIYRWLQAGLLEHRRLPSGAIRIFLDSLLKVPRSHRARGASGSGGVARGPAGGPVASPAASADAERLHLSDQVRGR